MMVKLATIPPRYGITHPVTVQEAGGVFSILVEILVIAVNALPIIVVTKWKTVRTRSCTDDLIVIISVFDMVCMAIPSPIVHASYFSKHWVGGMMTCGFYQIMTTWLRMCSLFALTTLSVDKSFTTYLFISQKRQSVRAGRFKIILFTFTVVLVCLMISSLPIIGLGPDLHRKVLCVLWTIAKPADLKEYVFIISFISFGICNLICIGISNIYILCKRKKIKDMMYGRTSSSSQHQFNVRVQLDGTQYLQGGKMVTAMSVVVYITWLPTMVLTVLKNVGVQVSDISILYSMLSTSLPGLLNPIIYGLCDSSYRRGYKRVFQLIRSCCHCSDTGRESIPSVVLDSTVRRSASDTAELSVHGGRNGIPHSTSGISNNTGVLNSAFAEAADVSDAPFIESPDNVICSNLVQELKSQPVETTRLLAGTNDIDDSSYFGGQKDVDDADSSSSMMSSGESYEDLRSDLSSEESEGNFRETVM